MPRILLVENDRDQRDLYREVLAESGYQVDVATSGVEALQMAKQERPDLVILDIQMAGMDGIEVLGKLIGRDRTLPVVFHSAYPAFKDNFMTWAADGFVEKSGDTTELLQAVKDTLEKHGTGRHAAAGLA